MQSRAVRNHHMEAATHHVWYWCSSSGSNYVRDLGQALFLAGEPTLLAVVRLGDSRTRECSFNAKVRMNITHVLKRAQALPFRGGECLSTHVLWSLLLQAENILQKLVDTLKSRDVRKDKKGRVKLEPRKWKVGIKTAEDKGIILNVSCHQVRISILLKCCSVVPIRGDKLAEEWDHSSQRVVFSFSDASYLGTWCKHPPTHPKTLRFYISSLMKVIPEKHLWVNVRAAQILQDLLLGPKNEAPARRGDFVLHHNYFISSHLPSHIHKHQDA